MFKILSLQDCLWSEKIQKIKTEGEIIAYSVWFA